MVMNAKVANLAWNLGIGGCRPFATGFQEPIRCGPAALAGIRGSPSVGTKVQFLEPSCVPITAKKFQCKECCHVEEDFGFAGFGRNVAGDLTCCIGSGYAGQGVALAGPRLELDRFLPRCPCWCGLRNHRGAAYRSCRSLPCWGTL